MRKGDKGEYGLATLELDDAADPLFAGLAGPQQIWMSHRDSVGRAARGLLRRWAAPAPARSPPSPTPARRLYGVQFHPEVVHTTRGQRVSSPISSSASAAACRIGIRAIAFR